MTARAWVLFAAVSVVWGIPYFFIKVAVEAGVPPALVAWSRVALGAAVLLPLAWRRGPCGAWAAAGGDCRLHRLRGGGAVPAHPRRGSRSRRRWPRS